MKEISQGDAQKLFAECMVLRTALEKSERENAELRQQDHDFRNEMQEVLREYELRAEEAEADLAELRSRIEHCPICSEKCRG